MVDRLYLKGDAVKFGWEKVIGNIPFFLEVSATVIFINILPRISDALWGPSVILGIVFFLLMTFVNIGLTRISLNFVDGTKSVYADLFSGMALFLKYLGATILYMIAVFVGLFFSSHRGYGSVFGSCSLPGSWLTRGSIPSRP